MTEISWTVVAAMALLAVLVTLHERTILQHYRKMSSRFPMFAARDSLVSLVASGTMSEDDPVWRHAYEASNSFLHMEEKLDVHDFIARLTRHEARLREDLRLHRDVEMFKRKLRRAAQEIPEFGEAVHQIDVGLFSMVRDRTTRIGWVWLKLRVTATVMGWALSEKLKGVRPKVTISDSIFPSGGPVRRAIQALKKQFSPHPSDGATAFLVASDC